MKTLSLSARARLLRPSPTLGITAKAKSLRAAGVDVISLAAGEPDFQTPAPICDEAIEALKSGFTKYTPSSGIPGLKEAIADKLDRENGVQVEPIQVVVSCGAKHSVFNSMMVLLDPGDEVILVAPYWMTYADQVRLAGATPVVVGTKPNADFIPDLEAIREKISSRTKAIVLNSPSNPTGAMYPAKLIAQIAELAVQHDFWIVSDEIYERLSYGSKPTSPAALSPEIAERTITINGVSKTFAMTGWRIGFAAAPIEVATAMSNFQDQVTSNPTSFAQRGAVAAYKLPAEAVESMRDEFQARRNLIVGLLRQIPNVSVSNPCGAFYVFPNVSAYLGGQFETDVDLANHLLDQAQVATIPGSVFEGEGHLRLSYAASRQDIERGVARIADALSKI